MVTGILFLLGFLAMICPAITGLLKINVHWIAVVVLEVIGILLITVGAYLSLFKKFFKIPKANEAIIRTGKGKMKKGEDGKMVPEEPEVAIGYGLWVIPMFHQFVHFKFKQIVFPIEKKGNEALQCSDGRLADVSATCKISVMQTKEAVLKFLAAVGDREPNREETYKELTLDTLETSLRDAATNRKYDEVFIGRDEVAGEVDKSVRDDFSKIGVQMDTVKLREVEPTPLDYYKVDNPQHAVGRTAITVITEDQRLATQQKILATDKLVKENQVVTRKQILSLEQDQEIATAEQAKQVAISQAINQRESQETQIQQEETVGKREIAKSLALQQESVNQEKQIALAKQQQEREVAEAEVAKVKAVELAKRDQEIAIANKDAERAKAEAERLAAEKEKEAADQAVETTKVTAEAERAKQKTIIDQTASSERDLIRAQKAADADAYAVTKKAEAGKAAADADYQAKVKAAEAVQKEKESHAAGLRAEQMVPVEVAAKLVEVDRTKVEVLQQELKAKTDHESISKDLQIQITRITADKEVAIAMASALGEALGKANMTIWGDPTTFARMTEMFTQGQMKGQFVGGLLESTPQVVQDKVSDAIGSFGDMVGGIFKKFTGKDISPEQAKTILSVLQDAAIDANSSKKKD